jgi:uncharacterized phage protein gp47/JayE
MTTAYIDDTGVYIPTLEEIQQSIKDELLGTFPLMDLTAESFDGQLIEIFADRLRDALELTVAGFAGMDPAQGTGFQLRAISSITGTLARAAQPSVVPCTVTVTAGTYAAGTLIAHVDGDASIRFFNQADVVAAVDGTEDVLFECEVTGPTAINTGTLTVIAETVTGWSAVTNTEGTDGSSATLGSVAESDSTLRLRREAEIDLKGSARAAAIRADLLEVDGVTAAKVTWNDTDATVGGIPAHAIACYVTGGTDADVAAAIANSKADGIQAYGTTTVNVTDEQGEVTAIGFFRPSATDVYVTVTLDALESSYAGDAAVKAAILAYIAPSPTGRDVIYKRISSLIMDVAGVVDLTSLTIGTAPSPVGTSNITIAVGAYATSATPKILVTSNLIAAEP